ncbi:NapC/NirT family cytochrome c, partial [Escherichia coli]|uniref:NapC/NirT family cytochrome c n=1 Tax=Escherichia coli TaxID=562 RepID=UPI0019551C7C
MAINTGLPIFHRLVMHLRGIVFWGGFNTGMEKANTEEFCISCHEMRNTVYQEYMDSVHY